MDHPRIEGIGYLMNLPRFRHVERPGIGYSQAPSTKLLTRGFLVPNTITSIHHKNTVQGRSLSLVMDHDRAMGIHHKDYVLTALWAIWVYQPSTTRT